MKQERNRMKRTIALILAFIMIISLSACGKSKAATAADELIASIGTVTLNSESAIIDAEEAVANLSSDDLGELENLELLKSSRAEFDKLYEEEQKRLEEERTLTIVTSESWFGIYEGDEYKFNADGTGSHNGVSLEYQVSDGMVNITEGAAGTTKYTLLLDDSANNAKLFIDGSENYYVQKEAYDSISEGIRAEYTAELIGHEAWTVRNGLSFVMYFMFFEGGGGYAVTTADTYSLEWEFADNNTLKITVTTNQKQSANYDIVVENGSYTLVQASNSAVTATPHN